MFNRAAFTIAVGKPIFIKMAVALARSFCRWNASNNVGFTLYTDRPISERPADLKNIDWVEIRSNEFGTGFAPKLNLDKLAPAKQSLFIDADCLCVRSLLETFETFQGKSVSVSGRNITSGDWFGDTRQICRTLGVVSMPRFNGGIYYLEPGDQCTRVFDTARRLAVSYDDLGFLRLRGFENDEVLMSAAMALHGQAPIEENGRIMHTAAEAPGGIYVDVLKGVAVLLNPRNHPRHFDWMHLERMEPAIVHFLGSNADEPPYSSEILALGLAARGVPFSLIRAYKLLACDMPYYTQHQIKAALRPLFHRVFGPRKVRGTLR